MTAQAPESKKLFSFGQNLKRERLAIGFTVSDMADRCRVSRATYSDWEADIQTPSLRDFKAIVVSMRRMRFYPPTYTDRVYPDRVESEIASIVEDVLPVPMPTAIETQHMTFGQALLNEMQIEDVEHEVIADLCQVSTPAVRWWCSDVNAPILEHYNKLLGIFPRLHQAPRPPSKDMEKPNRGVSRMQLTHKLTIPSTLQNHEAVIINQGVQIRPISQPQEHNPFDEEIKQLIAVIRLTQKTTLTTLLIEHQHDLYQFVVNQTKGSGETPAEAKQDLIAKLRKPMMDEREALKLKLAELNQAIETTFKEP